MLKNPIKDKNGFTLIEIIVVIVILSILLVILIPGLISYIDKAKNKQIEVNARYAYIALQDQLIQDYGDLSKDEFNTKLYYYYAHLGGTLTSDEITGIPQNGQIFIDPKQDNFWYDKETIDQNTGELKAMKYVEDNKYIIYTFEKGWGSVQTKE